MKFLIFCLCAFTSTPLSAADWKPTSERMLTSWGKQVDPQKVWTEHPRPQFQRAEWVSLNGLWSYAIQKLNSPVPEEWDGEILVPFVPEAPLSGVGKFVEPDEDLWYELSFNATPVDGKKTILHFEAVDYEATVWLNGQEMGKHQGGYTPFSFDVTGVLKAGENTLRLRVHDDTEGFQLHGKQSLNPQGIWASRVTGIWQPVWLEEVPERFISKLDFFPDLEANTLLVKATFVGEAVEGEQLRVTASLGDTPAGSGRGTAEVTLQLEEPQFWTPDHPHLYDLDVELISGSGEVMDRVKSYSAMRHVGKSRDSSGNMRVTLNGSPIFLFGTLDQGMWPGGLLTPPSDEAMLSDLKFLKAAGFNMIRKHVKVESSRYYYHCDRLGIAVWQDQVSCSLGTLSSNTKLSPSWTRMRVEPKDANWPDAAHEQWVLEYKRMVDHLRNHPSIFVWAPFNEAWGQHRSMAVGEMAVAYDTTRLICLASGGNFWPVGDIASAHNYPEPAFPLRDRRFKNYIKVVGEMGGHGWPISGHVHSPDKAMGYGGMSKSSEEWKFRYSQAVDLLADLRRRGISAGVYTETADTWNEVNGLLTYDREPKVKASWLRKVNDKVLIERISSNRTGK